MNMGNLEQRARELLAHFGETDLRSGERAIGHSGPENGEWETYIEVSVETLARIAAALSQQPEARGGVACPTCGAPAVRSEREGVLEIEDVYRHLPDRDESERLDWLADQMRIVDLQLILGSTPLDAADLRAAIDVKRAALTEARNG